MINITKVELELIPDPDMYIFFEKLMRGVLSYISNRYSEDSNNYLKSDGPKQESKYIIYLETNNLHRYTVSKFLPASSFQLIDPKELDLKINILSIVRKDVFSKLMFNILKN